MGQAHLQPAEQGWAQLYTGQARLGLIFPEWQRAGPYEDGPGRAEKSGPVQTSTADHSCSSCQLFPHLCISVKRSLCNYNF